jgi:hypothetical protein
MHTVGTNQFYEDVQFLHLDVQGVIVLAEEVLDSCCEDLRIPIENIEA